MKYLQDNQLAALTAALQECPVGGPGSQRVLFGRLEAYIRKRTGHDKKVANKLGEQYVEWQEKALSEKMRASNELLQRNEAEREEELGLLSIKEGGDELQIGGVLAQSSSENIRYPNPLRRKRSQSAGVFEEAISPFEPALKKSALEQLNPRRARAKSFDDSHTMRIQTALGDFTRQATRRLMTDLVLTLNCSFPDYDFDDVKPSDFRQFSVEETCQRVNELLSDVVVENSLVATTANPSDALLSEESDMEEQQHSNGTQTKTGKDFLVHHLWSSIDASVHLNDCQVYSYQPDQEDDDRMSFLTEALLPATLSSSSSGPTTVVGTDENASVTPQTPLFDSSKSNAKNTTRNALTRKTSRHTSTTSRHNHHASGTSPAILWSFNYFFVSNKTKRIVLFTCLETVKSQSNPLLATPQALGVADDDGDDEMNHLSFWDEEDEEDENSATWRKNRRYLSSAAASYAANLNFDMDPSSAMAGGIPISNI